MKKNLSVLVIFLLVSSFGFSKNFFSERVFEIKTNIPASASNNVFSLDEILTENLVIDLRKIAGKVPKEGVIFTTIFDPSFSINLNIASVHTGVDFGLEGTERFTLSKDIFDFFGYGNQIGEELNIAFNNYTDLYIYINARLQFDIKECSVKIMPSLFVPLFTSSGVAGSFSSVNTEEGNLILKMQTDLVYYSNFDIEEPLSMIDAALFNKAGVDLTGEAGFPINDMASLRVGGRVPIVPGRINTASYVTMNYLIDTSVTGIADTEIQSDELTVVTSETVYYSNRPLKASAYMDIAPMGDAVTFSFGGGVGIMHPFTPEMLIYPEYYLDVKFCLADMLKACVSTEYTDQVFKHQVSAGFNLRFVEIDAGISFQSASMTKSFAGTGMGGFVTACVGF